LTWAVVSFTLFSLVGKKRIVLNRSIFRQFLAKVLLRSFPFF